MSSYGFIITRHVNSEKTNRYWNHCIKLIRTHYPFKQIIIIDDNSNYKYVKSEFDYKNIIIIKSEYPKRGELLPYIYFLRYKWFKNAVILHDSVFIHKRIPFDKMNCNVVQLWHHNYDKDNIDTLLKISDSLTNNYHIKHLIQNDEPHILGMNNNENYLCFGCQAYINLHFLEMLESKYKITNLINAIHCRTDRCGLERIMGLLFCKEYPKLKLTKSLFGNIFNHHKAFNYTYDEYINDFKNQKVYGSFVKVWTGR